LAYASSVPISLVYNQVPTVAIPIHEHVEARVPLVSVVPYKRERKRRRRYKRVRDKVYEEI